MFINKKMHIENCYCGSGPIAWKESSEIVQDTLTIKCVT